MTKARRAAELSPVGAVHFANTETFENLQSVLQSKKLALSRLSDSGGAYKI